MSSSENINTLTACSNDSLLKTIVGPTWTTCATPRCPKAVGSKADNQCQAAPSTSTENSLSMNHSTFWATDSASSHRAASNWRHVFCRDPWVSVRGRVSGRDATRPAEGSNGEPADGAGWSGGAGEGAQPQPRGDLHSSGHQPRWTVAAPRGDLSFWVCMWELQLVDTASQPEPAEPTLLPSDRYWLTRE